MSGLSRMWKAWSLVWYLQRAVGGGFDEKPVAVSAPVSQTRSRSF